jgi:hypothetical protein
VLPLKKSRELSEILWHSVGNLLFKSDFALAVFDTDVQVLLSVCFSFFVIWRACAAAGRSVSGERSLVAICRKEVSKSEC